MAVNKVIYGTTVLVDLTEDTVTADKLMQGYTAHDATGTSIVGTYEPTIQSLTVTPSESQQVFRGTIISDTEYMSRYIASGRTVRFSTALVVGNWYYIEMQYYTSGGLPSGSPVPCGLWECTNVEELIYTESNFSTGVYVTSTTGRNTTDYDRSIIFYDASVADGYLPVTVNSIPSQYVVPSGNLEITANTASTDVTNYATVSVAVSSGTPSLQSKSITPTESQQIVEPDSSYDGLSSVTVAAISSGYVGSGIDRNDSTDLSASGATVTAPAGYYANAASKSVASGTEGTPTATKGAVIGHTISVTPSVTNIAGYISGGTHTGTVVSVLASELVSGTYIVDSSGTKDVTNYASASVPAGTVAASAIKGVVSGHAVNVTPNVTGTAGWISSGVTPGTAISVSASELVSGNQTLTGNGTVDVTNLASVTVDIDFVTYHVSGSEPTSSQGSDGDIWLVTE